MNSDNKHPTGMLAQTMMPHPKYPYRFMSVTVGRYGETELIIQRGRLPDLPHTIWYGPDENNPDSETLIFRSDEEFNGEILRLEEQLNYIDGGDPTPIPDFTKSFNKNLN